MLSISPKKINIIIFTLLGLFSLLGMGVDLIAPSLPKIALSLKASDSFSKNLITIFLFGMITGNLSIGVLSDSLGRRLLLLSALSIFVGVSLMPAVFPSIETLMLSRFLQGFTLAFIATLARAIFSDLLPPSRMMTVIPLTATMWGIGPIIGPFIGGYLQYYFNWQACFYFYAGFAFIGLSLLSATLPETHFKLQPLNPKQLIKNYSEILSNNNFIGLIILMGLNYSLLIVFNNFGPFFIQNHLGLSSIVFGKIALACGVIFLLGTLLCKKLLKNYSPKLLIKIFLPLGFLLAMIALVAAYFDNENLTTILILTYSVFFICGVLYPASMAAAMLLFRHLAASAAAMMSLVNITITCTSSLLMSFFDASSAMPLIYAYVILLLLAVITYIFTLERSKTI